MPVVRPAARQAAIAARRSPVAAAMAALLMASLLPIGSARGDVTAPTHLLISEVVTGGASASDELIEIHNPTASSLPLDGLEVIYVTASGATISRRAAWGLDAGSIQPRGHLLIANEAGIYAAIADATYASGMASTGGSVAIRIQGAATAIDAAGWGTTTSTWREGASGAAPAAGSSLERLPGGALGSSQDTDDNAADFVARLLPEPQNLASPPTPMGGPAGTPGPTPLPTPAVETPAPTPLATPEPSILSIGDARALPDGATATVEGVALAASDFHDGGGFVADAGGGIAVLVSDGAFPRGALLRLTGEIDDRFSQRTLRVDGPEVVVLGTAPDPAPIPAATGGIGEALEGRLVRASGVIAGSGSVLTTGLAFDIDDGSGVTRIVLGSATGIDASSWERGTALDMVGVVGQRDSSGEGTAGYRIMPRGPADIVLVAPAPTPAPSGSTSATPVPTSSDVPIGVSSIADARHASKNARVTVRGVVTLPPGIVDQQTAVIQDASGAIVLRLGDDVGRLALGERVEVHGTRSTKSGMETLRVTDPAAHLGAAAQPVAFAVRTGDVGEAEEARLVTVRGALAKGARRASTGSVSFDVDDGSGPLKVAIGESIRLDSSTFGSGTWVEVSGVLGQVTTGAEPERGYRLWPRTVTDIRIVATSGGGSAAGESGGNAASTAGSLDRIDAPDLAELTIGATLVVGPWRELGLGGLLWDGRQLVAVDARSADVVVAVLGERRPPIALQLSGLTAAGHADDLEIPRVLLGSGPGEVLVAGSPPSAPSSLATVARPGWAAAVGRLFGAGRTTELRHGGTRVRVDRRCSSAEPRRGTGLFGVTGIAIGTPMRLVVPCGAIVTAPLAHGRVAAAPVGLALRATQRPADGPAADLRRGIAAVLLGLAALGLAGLAAFRFRTGIAARGSNEAVLEERAPGEPAVGPRLALVRLPNERGP